MTDLGDNETGIYTTQVVLRLYSYKVGPRPT